MTMFIKFLLFVVIAPTFLGYNVEWNVEGFSDSRTLQQRPAAVSDETKLSTYGIIYKIEEERSTTEGPKPCDKFKVVRTCSLMENVLTLFSGRKERVEICDHILLRERINHILAISVHQNCSERGIPCERHLIVNAYDHNIQLGPGIYIQLEIRKISLYDLNSVSAFLFEERIVAYRRSDTIVMTFVEYDITIRWHETNNVEIEFTECSNVDTNGLCGVLNATEHNDRQQSDDKSYAHDNKSFISSWSQGRRNCTTYSCTEDDTRDGKKICDYIRDHKFEKCGDQKYLEEQTEICKQTACKCLAKLKSVPECTCKVIQQFVESCTVYSPDVEKEWRSEKHCQRICPHGTQPDCPYCVFIQHDVYKKDNACIQSKKCIPGCYCDDLTLTVPDAKGECPTIKDNPGCHCVINRGMNINTFGKVSYDLQSNCTYIIARDGRLQNRHSFEIHGKSVECKKLPGRVCFVEVTIYYGRNVIVIPEKEPIALNGELLPLKETSYVKGDINITIFTIDLIRVRIEIDKVKLILQYQAIYNQLGISIPSALYENDTEGLCGVCTSTAHNDRYDRDGNIEMNDTIRSWSWLVNDTVENCKPGKPLIVTNDSRCNDTEYYCGKEHEIENCQKVISYAENQTKVACEYKQLYATECCEKGHDLYDQLEKDGCVEECPKGMTYQCVNTCDKVCDRKEVEPCRTMFKCSCTGDLVEKDGKCIKRENCGLQSCVPVSVSYQKNYFSVTKGKENCTNTNPVPNIAECDGACRSKTSFDKKTGNIENHCLCCIPSETQTRAIELDCTDHTKLKLDIEHPKQCECVECTEKGFEELKVTKT